MAIIIIEPELVDERGHLANYDYSIAGELCRRGIRVVLFTGGKLEVRPSISGLRVLPVFHAISSELLSRLLGGRGSVRSASEYKSSTALERPWSMIQSVPGLARSISMVVQAVNNLGYLGTLISKVTPEVQDGDIILHSIYSPFTILTRSIWLLHLKRRKIEVKFVAPIHIDIRPALLFRIELRALSIAGKRQNVICAAHTASLAKRVGEMMGKEVPELPYPFAIEGGAPEPGDRRGGAGPVVFSYLGVASVSRGIDTLSAAIGLLRDLLESGKIEIRIQLYKELVSEGREGWKVQGALEELERTIPGIRLIPGALPIDRYYAEMRASDFLLILHRPEHFRGARSGVFSEALSMGRAVIVSEGTVMADELGRSGAGLTFESGSASSLAAAIRRAAESMPLLRENAARAGAAWRETHNPASYVDRLIELRGSDSLS